MNQSVCRYPDGNLFRRHLGRDFPVITHGEGIYLFDKNKRRYIDAVGGAGVACLGHGNQEVAQKVFDQIQKVAYVNGQQFTTEVTENLAILLAKKGEAIGLDRVSFLCSGSEAVEAAVKLARQICVERKQSSRTKLLVRAPSYHGNTLYALSASDRPHYKKPFGPLLSEVIVLPAPYEYRFDGDFQNKGTAHFIKNLEDTIEMEGPESIFGFLLEPVIGAAAGASVPPPGYLEKVQEICRNYGILTIADEVFTGAGRCGSFFVSEQFGFTPDILVLAKGLAGGYGPLSALMTRTELVDVIKEGSGNFAHAQTHMMSPVLTAAGLAVLEQIDALELCEASQNKGEVLLSKLKTSLYEIPHVGDVRGLGLMCGVELVVDKISKKPFPRAEKKVEGLVEALFSRGLVVWPNVGHADGENGDLILLAPPLIIKNSEIDEICEILRKTLGEYLS